METTWRLNRDNMETCWRQIGNKNGDTPWRQTWRQRRRQMKTKWMQNVHFYYVKWRKKMSQHGDTNGDKMETN